MRTEDRPDNEGPMRIVMVAEEERAALRALLRALRAVPGALEWSATIFSREPLALPATLGHIDRQPSRGG